MTFSQESDSSEDHVREPLPPQEEIAELPEDGGPEFNRLVFEQSPYLLQHARNPVDWWPWGEEAFARAREEDKPVFLSIGYTTCHWCHVMEHESFEDEEVAERLNEHFIAIKVDREERPDIDEVYMAVTQALTGSGGWPMTVMLTPDKDPFFAGTYFPKESVAGRAGLMQILTQLDAAWTDKRGEVLQTAKAISSEMAKAQGGSPGGDLSPEILGKAFGQFAQRYDAENGGFGSAPKFPVVPNLMFLLRHHDRTGDAKALEMVEKTLVEMRLGGVYDQVGFGIHRYSTTADWLVPHFEKMLYDQALAAMAYTEAWQVTGKEFYADAAREILGYVLRDMTGGKGGFYSAEDADSEGEEGKFYVWTEEEVRNVLGEEDGAFFAETFGFAEGGNFRDEATRQKTGANIPHLSAELPEEDRERVDRLRAALFAEREKRVHPQKDDKILTDWNGLMIAAFASAAVAFREEEYREAAVRAADFVLDELRDGDGRLLKRYRRGEAGLTAHLEDYAFFIRGLLELYEATFDPRYLEEALALQEILDDLFWDDGSGGYFLTADDAEKLIVRTKKLYGGAIPSGNAISLENLSRLYRITGDSAHATRAEELIRAFSGEIEQQPMAYPNLLCGLDFLRGPGHEIVLSGEAGTPDMEKMIAEVQQPFRPRQVVLLRPAEEPGALAKLAPYTENQAPVDGKATAYVCRDFACELPTNDLEKMRELLGAEEGGD